MRLIDADAIPYIDLNGDMPQSKVRVWVAFKDKIDSMPTIEPDRKNGYRDGYKRGKRAGYKKARDAGRKKGKWINHRNDNGHNIADCNICGNPIQWFDDDEKPRFCCMCGARMEEGEQR